MRAAIIVPIHAEGSIVIDLIMQLLSQLNADDVIYIILTSKTDRVLRLQAIAEDDSRIKVYTAAGAYPGRARNIGITRAAEAQFIVQIDAGCTVDAKWLDLILEPLVSNQADYTFGSIFPIDGPKDLWGQKLDREALFAALTQQRMRAAGDKVGGAAVAFKRHLWELSGGHPEDLRCGSDKLFAERVYSLSPRLYFAEKAKAFWELGPGVGSMLRREFRYSYTDALLEIMPKSTKLRLVEAMYLVVMSASLLRGWHTCFLIQFGLAAVFMLINSIKKKNRYEKVANDNFKEISLIGYVILNALNVGVRLFRILGSLKGVFHRFWK